MGLSGDVRRQLRRAARIRRPLLALVVLVVVLIVAYLVNGSHHHVQPGQDHSIGHSIGAALRPAAGSPVMASHTGLRVPGPA